MRDKLAIFDMDGTLIDTCMVNYRSYQAALSEEGIELTYDYFVRECFGKGYKDYLPPVIGDDADILERIHQRKIGLYKDYINEARLNSTLVDFVRGMRDSYYMALVTTASKDNVLEELKHFGLENDFDLVLAAEDIPNHKPDPQGFLMAMERFDIPPERTVIFEDSPVGIEAAKRSGASVMKVERI
ncbi:MAG: HAD family phosphatase [Lachnospiraceae bacterium]|nr:HAD family phosphatase [Lachnospiraceae bacterium]